MNELKILIKNIVFDIGDRLSKYKTLKTFFNFSTIINSFLIGYGGIIHERDTSLEFFSIKISGLYIMTIGMILQLILSILNEFRSMRINERQSQYGEMIKNEMENINIDNIKKIAKISSDMSRSFQALLDQKNGIENSADKTELFLMCIKQSFDLIFEDTVKQIANREAIGIYSPISVSLLLPNKERNFLSVIHRYPYNALKSSRKILVKKSRQDDESFGAAKAFFHKNHQYIPDTSVYDDVKDASYKCFYCYPLIDKKSNKVVGVVSIDCGVKEGFGNTSNHRMLVLACEIAQPAFVGLLMALRD